jgi:glycerate 2-kinase
MSRELLEELYFAAVRRVDPRQMIMDRIAYESGHLIIKGDEHHGYDELRIDLGDFDRILITGAGKASAPMAGAMELILEEYTGAVEGLVAVKYGHTAPTQYVRLKEAGHPVPDENSIQAGREIAAFVENADERSLVINLISGGGSALLTRPFPGLGYDHIQEMTRVLLECGADIHELNTLRKHSSGIKGGRMAELARPARMINILLSDVVGDDVEVIASGPGVPDPSTFADVWSIIDKYDIAGRIPDPLLAHFRRGLKDPSLETPKPGSPVFERVNTIVLGNNRAALEAAADLARSRGIESIILTSHLTGEAREQAKLFAGMAADHQASNRLILCGGETTVTLRGDGLGGRNQELGLSYLNTVLRSRHLPRAYFLAAGSDGNDGPTDAAGAIITPEDVRRLAGGPDPELWLGRSDSYHYLADQGILFKTGPTNTNVCDFCLMYFPS